MAGSGVPDMSVVDVDEDFRCPFKFLLLTNIVADNTERQE